MDTTKQKQTPRYRENKLVVATGEEGMGMKEVSRTD